MNKDRDTGPGSSQARQNRRLRPEQLDILFEDDAVIVVNKPAGLPAVPVPGSEIPSAWSLLSAQLKTKRQKAFTVHRIDRFTSGIMLFAKTQRDRDALVRQFLAHVPEREYMAVVRGHLAPREGTLVHYLRKAGMFQKLSRANDRDAARAELHYVVEQSLRGATLVRVALITGLQNQIRVQFSAIAHPVVGDRKHHPAEAQEQRIDRVALHAAHLKFDHPRSGKSISIECEPPQDFRALVKALSISKNQKH